MLGERHLTGGLCSMLQVSPVLEDVLTGGVCSMLLVSPVSEEILTGGVCVQHAAGVASI